MKHGVVLAIVMGSIVYSVVALADALPLAPGHYDVTVTLSTTGKTEKRDRCITSEHLANAESVLNYGFAKNATPLPNHTVVNFSVERGRISYNVDTPSSLIHVEGTISDTDFSVVRSHQSKSGKVSPVPMTLTLTGKRTGDCKR